MKYNVEDYRGYYNEYFKEFNKYAVDEYKHLSYGISTPNATSSSLESCIAYANYIHKVNDGYMVLDAGAGASTWMFANLLTIEPVISIDPNRSYLELVKMVCRKNDLVKNIFYLNGFDRFTNYFDHIYYDYGDIERIPYLGMAIEHSRKSVYVDDTDCRDDCRPYRQHVIDLCAAKGLKWFDCLEAKDEHGRWGIIIEK